jgi:hypothetical protein
MLIRLKKTRDGVVLACLRKAGDPEIQRTEHNGFFAPHDLMHYSVETTLGYYEAFFGLMASGWSFKNFTRHDDPDHRHPPPLAHVAENIVAVLSMHMREALVDDPEILSVLTEEINKDLASYMSRSTVCPPILTEGQIATIYRRFEGLFCRRKAVPIGEHLELAFPDDVGDPFPA